MPDQDANRHVSGRHPLVMFTRRRGRPLVHRTRSSMRWQASEHHGSRSIRRSHAAIRQAPQGTRQPLRCPTTKARHSTTPAPAARPRRRFVAGLHRSQFAVFQTDDHRQACDQRQIRALMPWPWHLASQRDLLSGIRHGSRVSWSPSRRPSRGLRFACLAAACRSDRPGICHSISTKNGWGPPRMAVALAPRHHPRRPRDGLDCPLLTCSLLHLWRDLGWTSAYRQLHAPTAAFPGVRHSTPGKR